MTTDFWTAAKSAFERPGEVWRCSPEAIMVVENGVLRFRIGGNGPTSPAVSVADVGRQWTRLDPPAPTLVFEPDGPPRQHGCKDDGAIYPTIDGFSRCRGYSHSEPVQHYRLREDAK